MRLNHSFCFGIAVLCVLFSAASLCAASGGNVLLRAGQEKVAAAGVAPLKQRAKHFPEAADGLTLTPQGRPRLPELRWIAQPGETFEVRATAVQRNSADRFVLSVWDWQGNCVHSEELDASGSGRTHRWQRTFLPESYGVWMLTLDRYTDSGAKSLAGREVASLGALAPVAAMPAGVSTEDGYVLGSCFFPLRYYKWGESYSWPKGEGLPENPGSAIQTMARLARRAGFTALRTDTFNYSAGKGWAAQWELYKEVAAALKKEGLGIMLKYDVDPQLFEKDTLKPNKDAMQLWSKDLNTFLRQIAGDARIAPTWVEVGNEPAHKEFWGGTQEQYVEIYKQIAAAFAKSPKAPVLMQGGTAYPGADKWQLKRENPQAYEAFQKEMTEWYKRYYTSLVPLSTYWTYHFHGALNADNLAWRLAEADQLRERGMDSSRLFQSEGGSSAWSPELEVTTMHELIQKLLFSMGGKEAGWIHYKLAGDSMSGRFRSEAGWDAVYGYQLSPKFQFGATAGLVRILDGARKGRYLWGDQAADGAALIVAFDLPDRKVLGFFSNGKERKVQINSNARAVQLFDLMGNPGEEVQGGATEITLRAEPAYLVLYGASRVDVAPAK